ncbi:hypothetical protein O181_049147 [Austropuccinia psidii MF-1]|uniref:Uncharacterized protein n=1 Tax=Austropuccinia psidii MF-1 TaxID=1389203 RepID=A0A9Q3E189_9BASI|nr:hypothetical protein [Austropuccinia psidii MF-1]
MPSTRSGASYNPSCSSQKGHRHDYGRSQSVAEGQKSVDDSQSSRAIHSEAYNTVLTSNRAEPPQEASVDIYKASQKAYNNALQHKEYQILADLGKNCMNSYLTVRKFLGHPNTCKLLNGWHPLMEKNMILLTEEWRKNNPPPPIKVPKAAPVASSSNSNVKKQPQDQNKGKGKEPATRSEQGQRQGTSHKALQPRLQNPKDSAGCYGKCIPDGQNNDGITEKGGRQIKISAMISDIFDAIPGLYQAINDVKSHVSDTNSSICNNLKTNNLNLG